MRVLVTGANGMIGSQLVKSLLSAGYDVVGIGRRGEASSNGGYHYYPVDLHDAERLKQIINNEKVDRIIHLAALAHTKNEADLSWEHYYQVNVVCSSNVFSSAGERPVLFISTVDVYGFVNGVVNSETIPSPVTFYGKSKLIAEDECRKLNNFSIFRFSPVYTEKVKRDIQKRYYLKYPNWAYLIGAGAEYEVLNVEIAVAAILKWLDEEPTGITKIIKDEKPLRTAEILLAEKAAGRAKHILRFPRWLVTIGYAVLKTLTGKNKYTYLIDKAVHPLHSETENTL